MIALVIYRICPGKDFALQMMYIIVACVLTTFNIEPALDEEGNPQMPKAEFECLVARYVFSSTWTCMIVILIVSRCYFSDPKPFKCTIKPRSDEAVKLVREAYDRIC